MMMMTDGAQNKLNKSEIIFILASLVSLTAAIRVEWNTNKGPIVPPTTTVKSVPVSPYRNPAPVWENPDDDRNPTKFTYLMPPPSRPKIETDNYARSPVSSRFQSKKPNYGHIITTTAFGTSDPGIYHSIKKVPTLAVYYVPNVGLRYDAVVPSLPSSQLTETEIDADKSYYLKENDIYDKLNTKLNGKYNHKLKKYKAYEKMKYMPYLYYIKSLKQQRLSTQLTPYSTQGPQVISTQQSVFDNNYVQQQQQQQQQEFIQENKYTKYMKTTFNDFPIKDKSYKKLQEQQWESKKTIDILPTLPSSSKPQR